MHEMTERERAAMKSGEATERELIAAKALAAIRFEDDAIEGARLPLIIYDVREFAAMHDAPTAYDAAQKAAGPVLPGATLRHCGYCERWASKPCGEGCHWSPKDPPFVPENPTGLREGKAEADPVAVVREAMGRLDKSGTTYAFPGARWKADVGAWMPVDTTTPVAASDAALATILNSLPALLAAAERANKEDAEYIQAAIGMGEESGYRDGVITGLEMAARHCRGMARRNGSLTRESALIACAEWCEREIDRIRSGGAIEGETANG